MQQFAEKAPLSLWIFVAGGVGVGLVVTACVIYRTWRAAGEDPVRNLEKRMMLSVAMLWRKAQSGNGDGLFVVRSEKSRPIPGEIIIFACENLLVARTAVPGSASVLSFSGSGNRTINPKSIQT
ncbi:MAG: hypothetical protein ACLR76_06395 [Alistipes sp.]